VPSLEAHEAAPARGVHRFGEVAIQRMDGDGKEDPFDAFVRERHGGAAAAAAQPAAAAAPAVAVAAPVDVAVGAVSAKTRNPLETRGLGDCVAIVARAANGEAVMAHVWIQGQRDADENAQHEAEAAGLEAAEGASIEPDAERYRGRYAGVFNAIAAKFSADDGARTYYLAWGREWRDVAGKHLRWKEQMLRMIRSVFPNIVVAVAGGATRVRWSDDRLEPF
jgi:hypothetical protein